MLSVSGSDTQTLTTDKQMQTPGLAHTNPSPATTFRPGEGEHYAGARLVVVEDPLAGQEGEEGN